MLWSLSEKSALVGGEKLTQRISIWQRGARAQVATLQRRYRVRKLQAGLNILAAQQSKKKSAVKGIAGAGSIAATAGHSERRRLDKLSLAINRRALSPSRQAYDSTPVPGFQFD